MKKFFQYRSPKTVQHIQQDGVKMKNLKLSLQSLEKNLMARR